MLFKFDNYVLDSDRRELRAAGVDVAIEPQVFDLIEFLIRARDRVVSRDDLIAHVWKGRIVSESALATRINAARRAIGDDGAHQALIKTLPRKGVRFVGAVEELTHKTPTQAVATTDAARAPTVTFCRTSDGVNIATASAGTGPLLLKTSNWLNHLEHDWTSPIWSPLFSRLAARFRLVRYDGRGCGLSDRDVADISFDGFVRDLEAVAATLAPEPAILLGMSQGVATAVAYAVAHPDRVSRLILYGGYAQGRNRQPGAGSRAQAEAMLAIMRQGWGDENSAFMRSFSAIFVPNGTPEQVRCFAEMQRAATTAPMAERIRRACDDIDVSALFAQIAVPTLVMHARHDTVAAYAQGRAIAAAIPNATFVTLDTEDHILLPGTTAWHAFVAETERFALAAREG